MEAEIGRLRREVYWKSGEFVLAQSFAWSLSRRARAIRLAWLSSLSLPDGHFAAGGPLGPMTAVTKNGCCPEGLEWSGQRPADRKRDRAPPLGVAKECGCIPPGD
ncbi:hypothetical protein GRI35_02870 [Altererythrobacter aestiaquae]|uniref:Uncharacterized protein n=1 Tax=Pontixanthobacter aestiaquae TaxID=1509367 RepID=A0A844Z5F0_9SPHN|nr:hypothetical protein [Pontixanthobacter aestiaquae]